MLTRLLRLADALARRPLLARFLVLFMPTAALLTICIGAVQGAVQQVYRSSADDPQIQVAEDAAQHLDRGMTPASVVGTQMIDIGHSLAVHVTIYDVQGAVTASDAVLDGRTPTIPQGVLNDAHSTGEDRVTWQPQSGVRVAAVAVPWHGGTVVAGRSLLRVEQRVDNLNVLTALGWVGGIAVLSVASLVAARLWQRAA